ncbi:hypothetical protein [Streptomyces sp. MW-W600-10]|uniref:hypothetical protein n=1 Tax=Streptomyces sp. MW-W600-10 TaxID=2829819 RepID=UPI001C4379B5|nr:hypothetical protein [Streptomyces sp. MW-W600-10]MBV7245368.1 hypothetical protein [Streptomyces sp. MW-W600-10]
MTGARFVTVAVARRTVDRRSPGAARIPGGGSGPGSALAVEFASSSGICLVVAHADAGPEPWAVDEHLVVDVDASRHFAGLEAPEGGGGVLTAPAMWLDQADVLVGSHPRATEEAVRDLVGLRSPDRGCLLAAVALAGAPDTVGGSGGSDCWIVTDGRRLRLVGCRAEACSIVHPADRRACPRADWSLFPSCLHGWIVAGHALADLDHAVLVHPGR